MNGMEPILSQLFYGNLHPFEVEYPQDSQGARLVEALAQGENRLSNLLEGEEKDLFLKSQSDHHELECLISYENFRRGFLLGARLMLEVFDDREGG